MRRVLIAVVLALTPGLAVLAGEKAPTLNDFYAARSQGDNQRGLDILQYLSNAGNPEADAYLAMYYESGIGVQKNPDMAARLYARSAAKGNAFGELGLATIFYEGRGVAKDYPKAMSLYQSAVQDATDNVEWLDQHSQGGDSSYEKDLRGRLVHAISLARNNIGYMYENGLGVEEDYAKAADWYKSAADLGYAAAERNLGALFSAGHGVQNDFGQAARLFRQAADQGFPAAQYDLATLYYQGKGVDRDPAQAVRLFRQAAAQGFAPAINMLGRFYYYGRDVTQNYSAAYQLFTAAAQKGVTEAQDSLGVMYQYGRGIPQNYNEAIKWYRLAAESGLPLAQWHLARMLHAGHGTPVNEKEAVDLWRKAANSGFPPAENDLGIVYLLGIGGVTRDYAAAERWFRQSALQSYAPAAKNLGDMQARGLGAPKDLQASTQWYTLAAKAGDKEAQVRLDTLAARPAEFEATLVDVRPTFVTEDVVIGDGIIGPSIATYVSAPTVVKTATVPAASVTTFIPETYPQTVRIIPPTPVIPPEPQTVTVFEPAPVVSVAGPAMVTTVKQGGPVDIELQRTLQALDLPPSIVLPPTTATVVNGPVTTYQRSVTTTYVDPTVRTTTTYVEPPEVTSIVNPPVTTTYVQSVPAMTQVVQQPATTTTYVGSYQLSWPGVRDATRVTSDQLLYAYTANVAQADSYYKGRLLETVGRVVRVVKGHFGNVVVEISPTGQDTAGNVSCHMRSHQAAQIDTLRPGQVVYISGKCEGMGRNTEGVNGIELKDSTLLRY